MRKTFIVIIFVFMVSKVFASVAGDVKQGNELYGQGDYKASVEVYNKALEKDSNSSVVNFNLGNANYRQEKYDEAVKYFQQTLLSDEDVLKRQALYNLGNTLYKSGLSKEDKEIEPAIAKLKESLVSYEKSFEIDEKDEDAKHNYEFVKKELERLVEKQQRQNQQQQNKEQNKENSENQKDQQKQEQENKEGNQENQQQSEDQDKNKEQGEEENKKQQEQESENKEGQEQEQENQEKEEGQSSSKQDEDERQKQSQEKSAQGSANEMTEKEAEMLLKNYQQNEESKGLLNLIPQNIKYIEVEKDW
ncbi:MAG: tetratricopeptide repeat protein [Candidatus Zapsychrus exili]|nr:tetratricopeptide repeat protein [Candidatus Zapsychrus exili]